MGCYKIFFSPTGGTKKVTDCIAEGMGETFLEVDLIKNPEKLQNISFQKDDICLIAVPSFGGRVPSPVTEALRTVNGSGAKAVLIAVFGNRAIDDTLIELYDELSQNGFLCTAGIQAVAEHSLMHQFGAGRPDQDDERGLIGFAERIKEKCSNENAEAVLTLPGNRPYREYNGVPMKPKANKKCTSCGICAKECPVGAIPQNDQRETDTEKCISCMHCVAVCPKQARSCSRLLTAAAAQKMKKVCSERKENKLYL